MMISLNSILVTSDSLVIRLSVVSRLVWMLQIVDCWIAIDSFTDVMSRADVRFFVRTLLFLVAITFADTDCVYVAVIILFSVTHSLLFLSIASVSVLWSLVATVCTYTSCFRCDAV